VDVILLSIKSFERVIATGCKWRLRIILLRRWACWCPGLQIGH